MTKITPASVWEVVRPHRGRGNPITAAEIARTFGGERDPTSPKVRMAIGRLVGMGFGVVACNDGYYVGITGDEYAAYFANLRSRALAILLRAKRVDANATRRLLAELQGELFPEEGSKR